MDIYIVCKKAKLHTPTGSLPATVLRLHTYEIANLLITGNIHKIEPGNYIQLHMQTCWLYVLKLCKRLVLYLHNYLPLGRNILLKQLGPDLMYTTWPRFDVIISD